MGENDLGGFIMAKNLSFNLALRGLLSDVARHRFPNRRQINPESQLFQTVTAAIDAGYLAGASAQGNGPLATIDLTTASLTPAGTAKLEELVNQGDDAE